MKPWKTCKVLGEKKGLTEILPVWTKRYKKSTILNEAVGPTNSTH